MWTIIVLLVIAAIWVWCYRFHCRWMQSQRERQAIKCEANAAVRRTHIAR